MEDKEKMKKLFLWGLLFVVVAYMATKVVDQYEMFFRGFHLLVDMAIPFIDRKSVV